jgi:putative transposase
VERNFTAPAPDRLWVGDLSHLRCWEGVVYLGFIIDVFSRMVVGWQLAANMRTTLVLDALRMALGLREPGADLQLVAHTDAGSQYTSADYTRVLDDYRVLASIGSVADAYDNALAESFVDSHKTELIADRVWRSRAKLELATVEYIGWFNHDRLHESLGDIRRSSSSGSSAPARPDSRQRIGRGRLAQSRRRAYNAPITTGRRRFRRQRPRSRRERSRSSNPSR